MATARASTVCSAHPLITAIGLFNRCLNGITELLCESRYLFDAKLVVEKLIDILPHFAGFTEFYMLPDINQNC